VPSTFVRLDGMPLTQSGKVDRQMLPAPAGGRPELSEVFVAPRTDAEQAIARIWGEVLRVDPIGVHDDFFDLGGHSLIATQIISRVNDLFGQQVSLGCLFDTPTIAGLAAEVERPGAGKVTR
jgi:acyl carrier protein